MKKDFFKISRGGVMMSAVLLASLCACGPKGSHQDNEEAEARLQDSLARLEQMATEEEASKAAQDSFRADSLQVIDEMVGAVEEASMSDKDLLKKYNATFFRNDNNKGEKASASKYAVTPTGLRYVIVREGSGKSPSATDVVTVDYTGVLTDGTQFDSSVDRGEPTSFPLNRVIPGWTEGLQLMKPGGTAVFYIPSQLAYGENGIPGTIPPGAPLIFYVNLIRVN